MSVGTLFILAAVVLFFLAAVGSAILPNPTAWGFVCFALGHLLGGVAIPVARTVVVTKAA
jgi:hypothetical protein